MYFLYKCDSYGCKTTWKNQPSTKLPETLSETLAQHFLRWETVENYRWRKALWEQTIILIYNSSEIFWNLTSYVFVAFERSKTGNSCIYFYIHIVSIFASILNKATLIRFSSFFFPSKIRSRTKQLLDNIEVWFLHNDLQGKWKSYYRVIVTHGKKRKRLSFWLILKFDACLFALQIIFSVFILMKH